MAKKTTNAAKVPGAIPSAQFPRAVDHPSKAKTFHHASDQVSVKAYDYTAEDICTAWALLVNHFCDEKYVAFGAICGRQSLRCPYVAVEVEPTVSLQELQKSVSMRLRQQHEVDEECAHTFAGRSQCGISTLLVIETAQKSKGCLDHGASVIVQCQVSPRTIYLRVSYDLTVIGDKQMSCTLAYFRQLLIGLGERSACTPIEELKGCSKETQLHLEDFNSGITQSTSELFQDLFAQQARCRPSNAAICSSEGKLTYEQLDQLSGGLARALRKEGVGPESIVPLGFSKSRWAVIAMLAVAKANGAFVFLDGNAPPMRNNECLRHATVDFVLTSGSDTRFEGLVNHRVIDVEKIVPPQSDTVVWERTDEMASASNLLYVIFTSGSTGPPKAVAMTHTAFCSSAMYHSKALFMTHESRVFQFSSFTFDVSMLEILTTLCVGGCICIPTDDDRHGNISESMERMHVNWAILTPSIARILDVTELSSLKTLVFAGEAVREKDLVRWRSKNHEKRILMCYGPSECAIISTVAQVDLAKPVPEDLGFRTGCALWIVDPNDPHILLPYGAEGELVVEGPDVGRGYLSMPERTARAWINAPKWARNEHHDYRRRRFYLSGDICKLVDSGSVHFVRRKDSQVKLRGQRIAFEEVEAKLEESLPGFVLAADIVHYETEQTDRTLLLGFAAEAYGDSGKAMIVPRAGVGSLFDLTLSKLKKILPPYMVPSAVVPLSVLPLNRSGKLDRRQLKTLATAASTAQIFGASAAHTSAEHTLTDLQAQLRSLWHRILGTHIQNIGVYDNFFKLGADSVTAISLVALAKREGLLITVADILKFPTLAELASVAVVAREEESSKVSVPKCFSLLHDKEQILSDIYETYYLRCGMIEDVLPCTSMQEGLMLLSTRSPGAYIGQEVFELPEDIDISLLKKAWTAVCSVIPIWRTRIVASYKGKTFQVVLRETVQWQEFFSLAEMRQEQSRQRMSLGDRLVNFALIFDKQRRASHFVMTAHHSLYDAWTLALTFEQFRRTYHGQASRPLLPMSVFVDQTASQRSESLEFWTKYLHNLQSTPFPRSNAVQTGPSHSRCYEARLQVNMPTESKWTAFTVIKAAWAILSNHFTSCEDIIFGTTVSGRQSSVPGIDSICGPTIATVPCRVRVEPQLALRELFDTIQKDAADMIVHEQVGLQTIQRISDSIRHGCDFGCLILMQSRNSDDERATDILGPRRFAEDAARTNSYALTLDLMPTAEGFHITAAYDTRSLSWDRVEAIVRHMEHLLQRITSADETTRLDKIPTVRDEDLRLMQHRRGNPRSREKTAHELIEVQVYTQPDAVAISSWDGGDLTYGRLWQLSDCLSAVLRRHGVGPDVLIPLVFEKSMWAVVAMLSVLKAGGGFVSIDPNGPKERACLICDEVNASVVLASAMHKDLLLDEVQTCIAVDSNIFERGV